MEALIPVSHICININAPGRGSQRAWHPSSGGSPLYQLREAGHGPPRATLGIGRLGARRPWYQQHIEPEACDQRGSGYKANKGPYTGSWLSAVVGTVQAHP